MNLKGRHCWCEGCCMLGVGGNGVEACGAIAGMHGCAAGCTCLCTAGCNRLLQPTCYIRRCTTRPTGGARRASPMRWRYWWF